MAQGYAARLSALAAACLMLAAIWPARAESTLRLDLVETVAPQFSDPSLTMEPGRITYKVDHIEVNFSWTAMPQSFGASGFKVTLTAKGHVDPDTGGDGRTVHTTLFGSGIKTTPDLAWAEITLGSGDDKTVSQEIAIVPESGLTEGQIIEIHVGTDMGPTYLYRYKVSQGGPAQAEEGQLTATLEGCPESIVISALPGQSCHLMIGGFRHNTADPVEVVLPSSMDGTGNHGNGLQLLNTSGSHDVYNMEDPYPWLVSLFACPGQKGAGVNCYGTVAKPGLLSVPIVVQQKGSKSAQVTLSITAVAGPNSGTGTGTSGGGEAVTSTMVAPAPGQLGARIECAGMIYISAAPGPDCVLVISGWTRNTPEPVVVTLPAKTDDYGNHANGIQVLVEGESDVFSWEADENYWEMSVFACPGDSGVGADCFGKVTTPGIQTVPIRVEQRGLAPADIILKIDAQPDARP